jgi:transposase-like protein
MLICCPYCLIEPGVRPDRPTIVRYGHFRRRSDSKRVQRFRCLLCKKHFSQATFHPCYRQKKRHKNEILRKFISSAVSQRRLARNLNLTRVTIKRKKIFLSCQALLKREYDNLSKPKAIEIQFDDLETFEDTRYKPLSVTLAVEKYTRRILDFEVSQMPCKGSLAKRAIKKYGNRADLRVIGRNSLFERLKPLIQEGALIESDSSPHYPLDVKRHFPKSFHRTFLSRRAAATGQGELKEGAFDPLFSLNHTFGKLRADMSRLVRKTWCTTKKAEMLTHHLNIYAQYHNEHLKK